MFNQLINHISKKILLPFIEWNAKAYTRKAIYVWAFLLVAMMYCLQWPTMGDVLQWSTLSIILLAQAWAMRLFAKWAKRELYNPVY